MFRLFDTLFFTIERMRQHLILIFWVLVGLTVATTLTLGLTLYIDAVYSNVLSSRLPDPPFAFRYRYLGQWNSPIQLEDVTRTDAVAGDRFIQRMDLPVERDVRYVRGGTWQVAQDGTTLGALGVGVLDGAAEQITIVDGQWPPDAPDDDAIPVLIPEDMFYRIGVAVGDTLAGTRRGGGTATFEVAALWRPVNPDDPSWIFTPRFFDEVMLVENRETLLAVNAGVDDPIDEAVWYVSFDGSDVRTTDVDTILGHVVDTQREVNAALPGIRQDLSPEEELRIFNQEVDALTNQLFIIIAPVAALVLYFVSLVAGLLVTRQQGEDVKLRSRGMSRLGVLSIHILMWSLLALIALGLSVIAAPYVVRLVGQTASFLQFTDPSSVGEVVVTTQPLLIGTATAVIAASSGLFLAWQTTRQNINSYRQQMTTASKAWWQRMYLDLLLLIPAAYVLYDLNNQGGLTAAQDSAFSDPVVFIGPTLFALALALAFLRFWPVLMGVGAKVVSVTRNISLLMALRELTRSIGRYRGALLMMAFTLSLTGFTASMASTLDRSLRDTINYRVGADMVLVTAVDAETDETQDASGQTNQEITGYNVPPVNDLEEVEGIAFASRVGTYDGRISTPGGAPIQGTVMGIDRAQMPAIARFREDFSDDPLGELLNKLAGDRTGIIISQQAADEYNIIPGQEVTLGVQALNTWFEQRVRVIDTVNYFPTLNPADEEADFFVITNIDPIFELVGTALPHDIWLSLADGIDPDAVQSAVREIDFPVLRFLEPTQALVEARAEPARRGVLGFLSIGFIASITLTLIASIIQSTASFRAQSTQLGALRAMGLSSFAVGLYVIILQGMSALSGILAGTSIGVATTLLFLPLLDFSGGLPPYLVRVAWDEITVVYAVFALVLLFVTLMTTLVLSREQLASVVRLGDA
jgi:putative ABC transport system permease protein